MYQDKDIDEIIRMLDAKAGSGVSRIKVTVDETVEAEGVKESYHHGRCDIGSPWAKGTVRNEDIG